MSAAPLPTIEQWLSALVPRVRALRVARGACRLVAAALGAASVVLLLDAAFNLPTWGRGLFLSVWLTAIGVLTWRWVLVPWRGELALSEVAGEVERSLPELGERLRAAVSAALGGPPDTIREAIDEDTARRARVVDRTQAIPLKPAVWLAASAAAALLAAIATAAGVSGTGERLRRVALPWHRPSTAAFRVVVTSGDPVVRRGGSVTLSAYAERTGRGHGLPEAVLIVTDDPHGEERRIPMAGDGTAFHATLPSVPNTFGYCVEVNGVRSEWFTVTALDPVELAQNSRIEIAPPAYAKQSKRVLSSLTDFDGLQFGTAIFQLKFTQPAAFAHFDWRAEGAAKSELVALDLAPDRRGTGTLLLRGSGVLHLVLVREVDGKKLRTETAVGVRVARDEPPWFEEMSGVLARPRTARSNALVPIAFVVRDDISVARAMLEYTAGPDETKTDVVLIPLTGAGTVRAVGRFDFDLAGKGREGDTIRFRIVVTDNRAVDLDTPLGPQVALYPPSGWSELRLTAAAPPLDEQEIVGQREAIQDSLAMVRNELAEIAADATALRTQTAGTSALAVDQTVRLNNAREKVHAAAVRLSDAARDAALVPELRPLATGIREIADRFLKVAEDALRAAETDDSTTRTDALSTAIAHLTDASAKLSELLESNARLGRDRLDRAKLTVLAADQSALAETKLDAAELLARQRQLLARLAALQGESATLHASTDAAKSEEVRRLAAALVELTARLHELDAAAKRTVADARAPLVAAITHEQEALAKRSAVAFAKLDTPARLAGVAFPAPDDFLQVAKLAAAGKTVEALAELEKHSLALERIAATFDKWHTDRADPKLTAKQLAIWQDDLLSRLQAAAKGGGFDKLAIEAKTALRAEQKALGTAIERLALPPDETAKTARDTAARHATRANECLTLDGAGADDAMKLTSAALLRLAAGTPPVAERLVKSLREVEKLRLELETTGNAIELAMKGNDRPPEAVAKKLAPETERQRKIIAAVAALDLPGLSDRQARVVLALKIAVNDLQAGAPLDIQASQLWIRREFDRLKLVLEGHPPPDAKVEELHRTLAALSDSLDLHGPTVTKSQVEPALSVVQEAQRQLALVNAAEAPALLNDARVALQGAESAFRDAKPDAIRRRIRAATDALDKLSDRLNGFESDADRIARLTASRRVGAEKPKEIVSSDEAVRQLGREVDELTSTRVGLAGQGLKKRALDLYAKLRAKTDPDRTGSDLKALVTTLDELAAKMENVADLTTGVGRRAPILLSEADNFLPSKPLGDELSDLANAQRAIRSQVATLNSKLQALLRPAPTNPVTTVEAKQRAIARDALALAKLAATDAANKAAEAALQAADHSLVAQVRAAKDAAESAANFFRQVATAGGSTPWGKRAEELVARQDEVLRELKELQESPSAATAQQVARMAELIRTARELATFLEVVAQSLGPNDATRTALTEAAKTVTNAQKELAEAIVSATEGDFVEAEKHRAAAEAILRAAAERVTTAAPPPLATGANATAGLALRAAERAMHRATDALGANDPDAARKTMRAAADALLHAAKSVGK